MRTSAVDRFVGDLHAAERALRLAYAACGRVSVSAAEAHADQNLNPGVGHGMFASFGEAGVAVSQGLAKLASGHRLAAAIGKSIGIDGENDYGGGIKPPSAG